MSMHHSFYRSTLAGVIAFSIFSGVISGFMLAGEFLPALAVQHNARKWYPGFSHVQQVGTLSGEAEAYAVSTTQLPLKRLWRKDNRLMRAEQYALIAHGLYREGKYTLGQMIQVSTQGGKLDLPIAGIWQPFHPQLGDGWLLVVGDALPVAAETNALQQMAPVPRRLPRVYQGSNLLAFWLFKAIVFIIYALIGLVGKKGHSQLLGWAAKLWVGALTAIFTSLLVASIAFTLTTGLPVLDLLPLTLLMLMGSYFSAALVMTGLCIAMTRL